MQELTEFCLLCEKYKTDKCKKYRHNYSPHYNTILSPYRDEFKNILEIGIGFVGEPGSGIMEHLREFGYERGASLRVWRDFFPAATIYGIDNREEAIFQEDRIKCILSDQTDKSRLENIFNDIELDFILDDGSHIANNQRESFYILEKYLKEGGIYIIEDINLKYWQDNDINTFFLEVKQKYKFKTCKVFDLRTDPTSEFDDSVFFLLIK